MELSSATLKKSAYALSRITKRIWFRAFLYGVIGIATAFLGLLAQNVIPASWVTKIGADAVGNILAILASSMLAVATFSLSIMVTAFGSAANSASPRASKLLVENQSAQRAVATFIGAFLYSIVGIIALTTSLYGENGRFVLFVVTILVIVVIVVTLIRWVDQLSTLGRIGDTIEQVENTTLKAMKDHVQHFSLKTSATAKTFENVRELRTKKIGFVALIDLAALEEIGERENVHIRLEVLPGSYLYPNRNLAFTDRLISKELSAEIEGQFVIEKTRTFEQDPRLGFVLLSEIASRALSPAVNDPGTAIEVMSTGTRLLAAWADLYREAPVHKPQRFERIFGPLLSTSDLVGDLFVPIARDGAGQFEVVGKLLKSLHSLANYDGALFEESCDRYSRFARESANLALRTEFERELILALPL